MHQLTASRKVTGPSFINLVFFTFLFSTSFAQDGVIRGKVRDNDLFLEKATVSLSNHVALTNSSGDFLFTVKAGAYILSITHVGYKKIEQEITIKAGETLTLSINMIRDDQAGEVVVLGSRSYIQRSNLNTAAPVDLITSQELIKTGQQSLIQMLNYAAPSFNSSRQNLFEPVTLRGLGPDHSLILLNGTRYHNSAYINNASLRGMLGRGSVSNDLNSIPVSAIEKIEILRDGATAQYGSDAIGGVMNILLKKTTGKTSINLHTGQYYKGDGESVMFGINHGILLNKKGLPAGRQGFLNFSGDFRFRKATHRGGIYNGTVYKNYPVNGTRADSLKIKAEDDSLIAARGFNRKSAVSNDGIIPLNTSGFLVNGGYTLNSKTELFWTGTATYRHADWPGVYRYPKSPSTVNALLFPNGFLSHAILNTWDISTIASARGKTNKEWNWEWNSSYGMNTNRQWGRNTNNASQRISLGANAPTEFYGGNASFVQQSNTVSFTKDLAKKTSVVKSFNISLGAEYRFEKIHTRQGEEAAWKNYDTTGSTQGGTPGTGSIDPEEVVNENRRVAGLYAELESDVNDHFLANIAARFENYNDFGSNLTAKLGLRYRFSSAFTIRGSASNGYHAPGLQQKYSNGGGNAWRIINGVRTQVQSGIFSNTSEVAKAFGVKPLLPEKATNLGFGITSTLSPNINITVDGYWIQLKNRIVLSSSFAKVNNPEVANLLKSYPAIDQVQFISNAINTRNRGIDIVLNSNWNIKKGNFRFMLAANFNRTNLFGAIQTADSLSPNSQNTTTLFNREERIKIEKGLPASKIILSGNYTIGKIGFLVRSTRFGETTYAFGIDDKSRDEFFSAKILTDLSINYLVKKWLTITTGVNNIFDVYPDPLKNYTNTTEGILIYSNESSPFGFNGGYYFVNMSFAF